MIEYPAKFYGGPKDGEEFVLSTDTTIVKFPAFKGDPLKYLIDNTEPPLECFGKCIYKLVETGTIRKYEYVETKWN